MASRMIGVLTFVAALAALAAPALSQQANNPPISCSLPNFFEGGKYQAVDGVSCARSEISRQLLINNAEVLARVVAQSFGIGGDQIAPAGLAGLTPDEAQARLLGSGALLITPTADVSQTTAPATKRWNTWIDGKDTWNDNSSANYNLDGPLFNGLAGIDYKLADKVTFGILGSLENSHLDGTGVNTRSNGLGAGPYLGITIGDHLVFSANALGSSIDSSQSGFYRYSADRLQAAAALNGYWYSGVWRFTPGLSLSWSKEWQKENHNLTPDQTIEAALLTPSVQFGRTFQISDRSTMEPWLGTALDWTFVNRIRIDGFAPLNRPSTDLRLQAGLNFAFGGNMQLSLTGEVGGLLLKDLNTYAGEANLAVQF